MLERTGKRPHMLAVCQPSVPAFAATAIMNADKHPARPKTLTMMGGPIDTRKAPTAVNTLATERPHAWFQHNVIATVPMIYPGAGRKVYPGFLQLAGFMTMNLGSHLVSHWEMFKHLVVGDEESADATAAFYDEYLSVCDMTAEFYLQTVDVVFQRHLLPKGELEHRGKRVDPGGDQGHRAAGDRGRARRYFGHRPDQGRARPGDQAAGGEEAISPRQGRRPLRHLHTTLGCPLAGDTRALRRQRRGRVSKPRSGRACIGPTAL